VIIKNVKSVEGNMMEHFMFTFCTVPEKLLNIYPKDCVIPEKLMFMLEFTKNANPPQEIFVMYKEKSMAKISGDEQRNKTKQTCKTKAKLKN